jgi:hypothetical protein
MAELVAEPPEIEPEVAAEIVTHDAERGNSVFRRAAQQDRQYLRVHVNVLMPGRVVEREAGRLEARQLRPNLVLELAAGRPGELITEAGPGRARREPSLGIDESRDARGGKGRPRQ